MLRSRDLPLLMDFVAVCRSGSISAAARELNTVQSAITQRIQRLEEACGTELLVRHSRGVSPSDQGKVMLRLAESFETLLFNANQELNEWLSSPSGSITFGLPPSLTPTLVEPLINDFAVHLPNVQISLTEAMSGYLEGWLENGETDFAVVFQRPHVEGISTTPLLDEELYLLVIPELAADLPASVTIRDIARLPLVAPSRRHSTRYLLESAAAEAGLELNILSIDAGHQLIRQGIAGRCGMVLSRSAAAPELAAGDLVAIPIRQPKFQRTIYLAERSEASKSYLVNAARQQFLTTFERLVVSGKLMGRPRGTLTDLGKEALK